MTRYKDNEKYIKNKEILDATQKLMEETNRSLGRYGIHVVATGCPEPAPPLRAAEKAYGSYGIEKNVYDLAHGLLSRLFPEFTTPPLDQRYRKWDGAFIEKVAGLINRYETDLPSYVRKASKYAKKHKFHKSGIPGGSSISAQAVMTDSQKSIDPPKQLTAHHPMKKYILLAATGACVFAYLLNSLDVISIASDAVMIPILFIAFLILMMYLLLPVPAVKSFNKNYENSYRTISKLVSEDNQACTMLVLEAWSQVTKQPIDELITSNLCNNRPQNVNRKSHEFNQNRSPQTSVTALKTKLG